MDSASTEAEAWRPADLTPDEARELERQQRALRGCEPGTVAEPSGVVPGWTRCPRAELVDDQRLALISATWRQWRIGRGEVLSLGEMPAIVAEGVEAAEDGAQQVEDALRKQEREMLRKQEREILRKQERR